MTWGNTRRRASAPTASSEARGWVMAPIGMQYGPTDAAQRRGRKKPPSEHPAPAREPEPETEKPTAQAKAQLAWHKLKSTKGWTEATQAMLLYEFVQHKGLFAELVTFMKKR